MLIILYFKRLIVDKILCSTKLLIYKSFLNRCKLNPYFSCYLTKNINIALVIFIMRVF